MQTTTTRPPVTPGETLSQARDDLSTALAAAALHGLNESIDNHFSLAVPGRDDRFLLNRYGPDWSEIAADDILEIDLDGAIVSGTGTYERTAFVIHRGVHRSRPSARCVLHTHMPYATAVALTAGGLDTRLSQNATYFHERTIRLAYDGLADAESEGQRIGGAVGEDVTVVMMENHGVLVIGESVADAWQKLYFLERACQVQVLAQSTGQELVRMTDDVARRTAGQWARDTAGPPAFLEATRRRVERERRAGER